MDAQIIEFPKNKNKKSKTENTHVNKQVLHTDSNHDELIKCLSPKPKMYFRYYKAYQKAKEVKTSEA